MPWNGPSSDNESQLGKKTHLHQRDPETRTKAFHWRKSKVRYVPNTDYLGHATEDEENRVIVLGF